MATSAPAATPVVAARAYLTAWGEATASFLDHLLLLTLGLGLPALLIGVAGHHLLDGDLDFWPWLLFRCSADLILLPLALAAGLWMSRRDSFYHPSLLAVVLAFFAGEGRLLWASAALALILFPAGFPGLTPLLALPFLALTRPHRWLEKQGPLWHPKGAGGGGVVFFALPLVIGAWIVQWFLLFWDVWSLEESTPLMLGLDQLVRVLLLTWGATVLFRLTRVADGA